MPTSITFPDSGEHTHTSRAFLRQQRNCIGKRSLSRASNEYGFFWYFRICHIPSVLYSNIEYIRIWDISHMFSIIGDLIHEKWHQSRFWDTFLGQSVSPLVISDIFNRDMGKRIWENIYSNMAYSFKRGKYSNIRIIRIFVGRSTCNSSLHFMFPMTELFASLA